MNTRLSPLLLLGLLAAAPSLTLATGPQGQGDHGSPGNPLVGMWDTMIYVAPSGCTAGAPRPPLTGRNTLVFNHGGTLVENPGAVPLALPGVAQVRTFGLGKWDYERRTGKYRVTVRFDWYATSDGAYLGYQVIDRTILLGNDRRTGSGPVTATRHLPDGTVLGRACGEAVSTRL